MNDTKLFDNPAESTEKDITYYDETWDQSATDSRQEP